MDMESDWRNCVQLYCNTVDDKSSIAVISNAIQNRKIQLLELIEELQSTITSTDISLREKGIKLLTEVMNCFPKDFLTTKEVEAMLEFMIFRLHDHHTIVPHALQGLLTLSQCSNFPKGYASKMLLSIFKEVHVPSQLQSDRYAVYQMIATLLQSQLEDLKNMESMVFGFIQVLDGERDPRCLLLAFHIIPQLIMHFDIGPFTEDLFEVMACYFPIDFNNRSALNMVISKEDLCASLHKCLISSPRFAPYLIPLLLEKLESDVHTSRLHAYHVLEASCKVFSPQDFHPFVEPLWIVIKKEVFMGSNEELENAALKSLTALTNAITPSDPDNNTKFHEYLAEILKECEHHLCQPEMMLIPYSAKVLAAIISASIIAADKIFSSVMPLLLQQYAVQTQFSQRKAILEMAIKLMVSMKEISSQNGCNPMEKFHDSVMSLFFSVLDDNTEQLSSLGLSALSEAIDIKGFLEERHMELLAHHLIHILISGQRENLRSQSHVVLSKLSRLHPTVTLVHIMPILKKQLDELDNSDIISFGKILEALVSASSHPDVLKVSLESMIAFLDTVMLGNFPVENSVLAASSLFRAITCNISAMSLPTNFLASCVIEPLVVISLRTGFSEDHEKLESVEVICDVIHNVACNLDFSVTSSYMEAVKQLHVCGKVPEIALKINSVTDSQMVSPLSKTVSLLLLKCMLTSMPQGCNSSDLSDFLEHLKTLTVQSEDLYISQLGAHCISVIVNKMENHGELEIILHSFYKYLAGVIEDSSNWEYKRAQNALLLWIWISKALVLRSHSQMSSFIKKLISWFKSDPLGSSAAGGISTIVEDSPKVFSPGGHAHVKLLYRQRFFIETSPQLCKEYNEAPQDRKSNYLIALCSQLKHLPRTVLISEMPLILPLMLQSLHHNHTDLQLAVLTCLEDILKENASLLEEHLNDLVPQLLTLASHSSMKVKIHSLLCLACLCSIPGHFLFPLRQDVIQKLKPCLDDKKRMVRKVAAEARCKWYLIGQPGS